jgi:threonine dehydrogenase-like Zn-dependent dehydrogenase
MRALVWNLSIPRYVAAMATGRKVPSLMYGALSSLAVRDVPAPVLPGPKWAVLRPRRTGLCGSDLAFLSFKASPTLSVFASNPSVLGHEILADVVEVGPGAKGTVKEGDRVVVDPVLTCETRDMSEPCARCSIGCYGTCERHADGRGAILGYSREHPGGFSERMVAHASQLFRVPDAVDDDRGVLAEPASVGVHAVMSHRPKGKESILVIGGGVIAFVTLWALKELFPECRVAISANERYQMAIGRSLGADVALGEDGQRDLLTAAAKDLGTAELRPMVGRGFLGRGYDRVFDCIGSKESLDAALRVVGPGGTVVLVGAAGIVPGLDLTTVWTREVKLEGTVYYGWEEWRDRRLRTFALTLELLASTKRPLGALVTHKFTLDEYEQAIRVNLDRRGTSSVKAVLSP